MSHESQILSILKEWELIISYVTASGTCSDGILAGLYDDTLRTLLKVEWSRKVVRDANDWGAMSICSAVEKVLAVLPLTHPLRSTLTALSCVARNPWGNPTLQALVNGQLTFNHPSALAFVRSEPVRMIMERMRALCENESDDMALPIALALATAFAHRPEYDDARDVILVLWQHLSAINNILDYFKTIDLSAGIVLMGRLIRKDTSNPLWKGSDNVAQLAAQYFITLTFFKPYSEAEAAVKELVGKLADLCARSPDLHRNMAPMIQKIVGTSRKAEHIYLLSNAIDEKFGNSFRTLCIELYIRGLTGQMNEREFRKMQNDPQKIADVELRLSNGLLQLANMLRNEIIVWRECLLTAFSLNPSEWCYQKVVQAAEESKAIFLTTQNSRRAISDRGVRGTSVSKQLNVAPDITIEPKSVVNAETLNISSKLCDDLAIVLRYLRYQELHWSLDWAVLDSRCQMYMRVIKQERSNPKELKFLKIDYHNFRNLSLDDIRTLYGVTASPNPSDENYSQDDFSESYMYSNTNTNPNGVWTPKRKSKGNGSQQVKGKWGQIVTPNKHFRVNTRKTSNSSSSNLSDSTFDSGVFPEEFDSFVTEGFQEQRNVSVHARQKSKQGSQKRKSPLKNSRKYWRHDNFDDNDYGAAITHWNERNVYQLELSTISLEETQITAHKQTYSCSNENSYKEEEVKIVNENRKRKTKISTDRTRFCHINTSSESPQQRNDFASVEISPGVKSNSTRQTYCGDNVHKLFQQTSDFIPSEEKSQIVNTYSRKQNKSKADVNTCNNPTINTEQSVPNDNYQLPDFNAEHHRIHDLDWLLGETDELGNILQVPIDSNQPNNQKIFSNNVFDTSLQEIDLDSIVLDEFESPGIQEITALQNFGESGIGSLVDMNNQSHEKSNHTMNDNLNHTGGRSNRKEALKSDLGEHLTPTMNNIKEQLSPAIEYESEIANASFVDWAESKNDSSFLYSTPHIDKHTQFIKGPKQTPIIIHKKNRTSGNLKQKHPSFQRKLGKKVRYGENAFILTKKSNINIHNDSTKIVLTPGRKPRQRRGRKPSPKSDPKMNELTRRRVRSEICGKLHFLNDEGEIDCDCTDVISNSAFSQLIVVEKSPKKKSRSSCVGCNHMSPKKDPSGNMQIDCSVSRRQQYKHCETNVKISGFVQDNSILDEFPQKFYDEAAAFMEVMSKFPHNCGSSQEMAQVPGSGQVTQEKQIVLSLPLCNGTVDTSFQNHTHIANTQAQSTLENLVILDYSSQTAGYVCNRTSTTQFLYNGGSVIHNDQNQTLTVQEIDIEDGLEVPESIEMAITPKVQCTVSKEKYNAEPWSHMAFWATQDSAKEV